MPNPARLVLLLVVVASIALLVPWTRTAPLPGDPSDIGDHPTASPAQPTRAEGTNPAADAARAEPADAGLERQAAAATATAATDRHEQHWRIAVVDGATLQPIPFAELLFVDRRIDYQQLTPAQLRLAQDDEEAFARAFGQRVVADASGRAELVVHGFASLLVRKDQLYGELLLNPNDRPKPEPHFPDCVLVRVHPDHTLRVRTVRPGGAPCEGVVVALRVASGSTTTEQLLPPTDAEGHSQLVHTQLHLHTAAGADHEATAVAVQVCVAGQDPAPVPLSLAALPIEPVVLTLPCTGAVALELQDVDGTAWPFPGGCHATFQLQPLDANGEEQGLEVRDGVEELDTMDARPLLLPQVACGARYQLRDDNGFFVPVAFDGPRAAEDVVRVGMALQPHVRVLTGRLLDAARRPFVGEAGLHFEAETENGRAPLLQDEQGRFTVLLDDLGAIEGLRIVERDFRRGGPRQAVLARTEPLPPGRTDVGDVVMKASPLLLAGRVTTGPGLEVDRARLQVQFEWAPAEVEPARRRWLPEQHVHVVLDRSGAFEAFQRAEGRRWRVLVTGFCAPFEPVEFEPGTRDLELRVAAPSSVVAEFVHPLLPGLDVQLWPLRPTDHDGERRRRQLAAHATREPSGAMVRLCWNGLAAGPHRLTVQVPGGPELRSIEFDVPAGGPATDGRLRGIDLRGLARVVTLRLRNGDGTPFDGPVLVVFPTAQALLGDRSGPEVSLVLVAPTDVLLLPYERQAVRLPALFEDATVSLAEAVPFAVAWPGQSALPDQVAARLQWTCVDGAGLDGPFTEFGTSDGMEASATVCFGSGLPSNLSNGRADGFCAVAVPMRATLVLTRMRPAAEGGPAEFLVPTATVVDPSTLAADAALPLLPDAAALAEAVR
jgi:hypothetical protein